MAFIGNTSTTQSFVAAVDYFSGNASTTAFTLSRPVASAAQVQVTVGSTPQNPNTAFTVSGNTITFTSAPPSGTNNIYVYYTSPITQVIAPSAGTVGTAQLASYTGTGAVVLATSPTITSPVTAGTPTGVGVLTSGTAVASTSGTSIDFTGIPSWVKRITVMFSGVSTSGSSNILIQIGSGSFTTSGYVSQGSYGSSAFSSTAGYILDAGTVAGTFRDGSAVLILVTGNSWINTSVLSQNGQYASLAGGRLSLSGALDRVRITTVNGTDTFDAGSINILYE